MYQNYKDIVSPFINKDIELSEKIYNSISSIFNSDQLNTLFSCDSRTIKYCLYEDFIIVFDKKDQCILVSFDFYKHKSELNEHDSIFEQLSISRIEKDNTAKLYLHFLFKMNEPYFKNNDNTKLLEKLDKLVKAEAITIKEKEDFLSELLTPYKYEDKYQFTEYFSDFKLLTNFLNIDISESFFKELIQSSINLYKDKFSYISLSIDSLIKSCCEQDFKSYEVSASFNDLDNHVWINPHNHLILSNQNFIYYSKFNNLNSYDIYYVSTEHYSNSFVDYFEEHYEDAISFQDYFVLDLENKIKNNSINDFNSKVFSFENGEVTFINPLLLHWFLEELKYSISYFKTENMFIDQINVDLYSYEYQKNYFCYQYKSNEFNFLCQAFLTLGGGFDYDKDKGILFNTDIEYIDNLPQYPSKENVNVDKIGYFYPNKFSFLNKEWTESLKYLIQQIEHNKPDFLAYDFKFKTKEEAFTKTLSYLKRIVKKNSIKE